MTTPPPPPALGPARRFARAFPAIALVLILLPGCAQASKEETTPRASTTSTTPDTTRARAKFSVRAFGGALNQPVWVGAPKRSRMVYAVERSGRIMMRPRTGSGAWKTFLNIESRVNDDGGEQGLLSVAFPANHAKSGYFFVYYTDSKGDGIVARYKRSGSKSSRSEKRYLRIPLGSGDDAGDNHNGGQLQFGPDGYLYIGVGDGGGAGDPFGHGQDLGSMLGKILRVDVSTSTLKIPKDNPFVSRAGARKEIFFLGLRNPWRFSFDRSTGDLWIGDVGQGEQEEVNVVKAPVAKRGGLNFGWNRFEGNLSFSGTELAEGTAHTKPNYVYSHATGGCSVTGGYVYRGTRSPKLAGTYVFADYCDAALQGLKRSGSSVKRTLRQGTSFSQISSFGEDGSGELLVAAESRVYRIS